MEKDVIKLFSNLKIKDSLKKSLKEQGFISMKRVQSLAIPLILSRKDVIVHSQTGSGKTLSYVVPILDLVNKNAKHMKVLIIVPTRELCMQVSEVISKFGFRSECFIGGIQIDENIGKLDSLISIGTPGRIAELLSLNNNMFSNIEYLVLDECDKLLDIGFENKLRIIINLLPRRRLTCMLSATCNENIIKLGRYALRDPIIARIDEEIPEKLELNYILVEPEKKIDTLIEVIEGKKAIVFYSTCAEVDVFYAVLVKLQKKLISNDDAIFEAVVAKLRSRLISEDVIDKRIKWFRSVEIHKIHGKMDQPERSKIYESFEKTGGVLLCTDLAARGIDFKGVDLVVHFDIPKDYLNIVHRSGRTARNDGGGQSIVFLMENEKLYIEFLELKKISVKEVTMDLPDGEFLRFLKEVVDNTILPLAVKAFVSYIRSYKEHIVNYILAYKELNFDGLAKLFFLKKIPTMVELRNVKFTEFERVANVEDKCRNTYKKKRKGKYKKSSTHN